MAIILAVVMVITPIVPTSDIDLFERIVEAEADPRWGFDGYIMLAQTVSNQLESGLYGNSYKEVLTRPNNYTVYQTGRYKTVEVSEKARVAVMITTMGVRTLNYGQLYFCTDDHLRNNPYGLHGRSERVARYDNVIFFR